MRWEQAVDPGERDRFVRLEKLTETRDSVSKAPLASWTKLADVWASKMERKDPTARERFVANQLSAAFETRWEIGYRADMDPELVDVAKDRRITYQGRTYGVIFGRQIGRRDAIELFTLAAGKVA